MNPKDLAKSESHMEKIRPYFEGKDVIMFRSDRGDTEELYRSFLPNIRNFTTIDEVDFPGNIHGMKYHFIQTLKNPLADMIGTTKDTLFSYWGRMKTGHDREKTIRQIYRDKDISTTLIGGMPSGIKRKSSWIKDWRQLYPLLETSRCTLCFNWIDNTATTSRYVEALAVGMIPFVWRDYDINNTYRIDDFQRITSFEMFKERAILLKNDEFFEKKLQEYRANYSKVLISLDNYFELFSKKMNFALDI